jgi:hypothetical protein
MLLKIRTDGIFNTKLSTWVGPNSERQEQVIKCCLSVTLHGLLFSASWDCLSNVFMGDNFSVAALMWDWMDSLSWATMVRG